MDAFDEWVKAAEQHPCLQEWGDKVVGLGASWDSFRRDKQEITKDLVQGGVPILAARDIVDIASKEVQRTSAPMAIFWDLENMPIPSSVSGRDLVSSLKTILAPHGDLTQFRGYASIGLNLIPQEKRSDLQLSGCHLVDCPHVSRKEVADKMIIVDAMQFAYQHPEGATLCFITGDVDYAYLLAVLQRHPEWRTIVISRGTMQSMLHVNCHMKMRWETDILAPIYASAPEAASETEAEADGKEDFANDADRSGFLAAAMRGKNARFVPLTADEFWNDDVELLRSVMIEEGRRFGTHAPRKSSVGNALRQTNPARFPNRDTIKSFFVQAIEKGVVDERGEGAYKTLTLSALSYKSRGAVAAGMKPSKTPPLPLSEWPAKTVEMAGKTHPLVILVEKRHCPSGFSVSHLLGSIQSTEEWLLIPFGTQGEVLNNVKSHPWMNKGTLVDWRDMEHLECSVCHAQFHLHHAFISYSSEGEGTPFCSCECNTWNAQGESTKQIAIDCTNRALQFMADNDDIYVGEKILHKILARRHPELCVDKKFLRLWVKETLASGRAVSFQRPETTATLICLRDYFDEALEDFPPNDFQTSNEEKFLHDLLWNKSNAGGLDRREVAKELREAFPDSMNTRFRRNKALMNAQANGLISLCKGPFVHIVGLTKEQAEAAMELEVEKMKEEQRTRLVVENQNSEQDQRDEISQDPNTGSKINEEESEPYVDSDIDHVTTMTGSSQSTKSSSGVLDLSAFAQPPPPALVSVPSPKNGKKGISAPPGIRSKQLAVSATEISADIPESKASIGSSKRQPADACNTTSFNALVDDKGNHASPNLHVSGFGPRTTKQDIYRAFRQFTKIAEVVEKTFGGHRFMFVNTYSRNEAIEARRRLHGTTLGGGGGALKINFAR